MHARPPETRPGPLCAEVLALLDQVRAAVVRAPVTGDDGGAQGVLDQFDALADRVRRPLRLGVCGEFSVGKSTLVNALLGSGMAPTGAAEATRLVTWYGAGEMERADVHLTDGTRRQVWLTEDGRVPDVVVPLEEVVDLHVQVPTGPLLRSLTLVDTPGLSSVRDVSSARSRAALYGTGETADGVPSRGPEFDALLFLLQGQQEEVDLRGDAAAAHRPGDRSAARPAAPALLPRRPARGLGGRRDGGRRADAGLVGQPGRLPARAGLAPPLGRLPPGRAHRRVGEDAGDRAARPAGRRPVHPPGFALADPPPSAAGGPGWLHVAS